MPSACISCFSDAALARVVVWKERESECERDLLNGDDEFIAWQRAFLFPVVFFLHVLLGCMFIRV